MLACPLIQARGSLYPVTSIGVAVQARVADLQEDFLVPNMFTTN